MFEVRKYKEGGRWTEWKEVSKEVAEHKSKVAVRVYYEDGEWSYYYPYQVREKE